MNKPTLLLDMDGPLADFDGAFYAFCRRNGWKLNIDGLHDPARKRFMTDNMPIGPERDAARRHVNTSHWFRELPVTDGALQGVAQLEEKFDVWVCTKPLEINPHCLNDKHAWLSLFFPTLRDKLITAPDKSMIHGDILLDDAPKPEWFARATWRPVLFPDTFNGASSEWAGLTTWTWGDPVWKLVEILKGR